MAITVESTGSGGAVATSLTFAHVVTAAELLWVGGMGDTSDRSTTITYNSVPLVMLFDRNGDSGVGRLAAGILASPAVGNNNVVVTVAGTGAPTIMAASVGFIGVVHTSEGAAHRTVYQAVVNGDPSVTIADSQSGDLVVDTAVAFNATIAAGGSQTQQVTVQFFGGDNFSIGISTLLATGANTVMTWTGGTAFGASGGTALIPSIIASNATLMGQTLV